MVPFPKVTIEDFLKQAATDIVQILSQPPSSGVPTLEAGSSTRNELLKLADILQRAEKIPILQELQAAG